MWYSGGTMSEVYDLKDYAFAKQMVDEIPKALEALEITRGTLYKYHNFNAIVDVLQAVENASLILGTRLPYFENILASKGERP